MSLCAPCTSIGELIICDDEFAIGTVSQADTNYFVYFKNLATDRIDVFNVTSDADGLLVLEVDGNANFATDINYEIWVNTTGDVSDRDEFETINNTCIMGKFVKVSTTPTPSSLEKSVYVPLSGILGSSTPTNALKTWLVNKGITNPISYLGSLLDNSTNRAAMRTLNSELNTLGITKRSANVTQSVNAITISDLGTPAGFNTTCSNASEKFTAFSQEWEFWKSNPYGNFETFKANDLAIYNFCQANNIEYNIYVARCADVARTTTPAIQAEIAEWLVDHHTNIYLVDYVSTAKFNTYKGLSDGIKEQLQLFANAAKVKNKVQKVQILWASEGNVVNGVATNMFTYFQANPTLIPAYNTFMTAYNQWSFANKSSLSVIGQNIYSYDSIKSL